MPKSRRPRLSWFRFYADDFLGGTGALTAPECGRYLLLLLHQWSTKEAQLIPGDPNRLRVICRGEDPGPLVLAKFAAVNGGFRNQRLADEWVSARHEYDRKAEGGGAQIPGQNPGQIPVYIPPRKGPPTKNQEPDPSLQEGRKEEPPALPPPPEQRAENATTETIHSMQLRLGGLLTKLAEHPNSRLMVPGWSARVTSYDKSDGTHVKGRSDFRTVQSIERLEKSIGDAEWYLAEMDKGVVYGT